MSNCRSAASVRDSDFGFSLSGVLLFRRQQQHLALAGVVNGFAKGAGRLLRRVEASGVFRGDEIEPPLRLTLEVAGGSELLGRCAARHRG